MDSTRDKNLLIVVGSRHDEVCSIGSFARSEEKALRAWFKNVVIVEPNLNNIFPQVQKIKINPDYIIYHSPSLYDRKKPLNAVKTILKLKATYRKAKIISTVHEYSEAPWHWKARQDIINFLSDAIIVNSQADRDAIHIKNKKLLQVSLGPTLNNANLIKEPTSENIKKIIKDCRIELVDKYKISAQEKWVLHPGLLTPGKGIDTLINYSSDFDKNTRLILMGGFGPKQKDRNFANKAIHELDLAMKNKFSIIENPSDEDFSKFLTASDLIILPYEAGVSERRSSFLSAMSCGGNVCTTTGAYSNALELDSSGIFGFSSVDWKNKEKNVTDIFNLAINEQEEEKIKRRIKNLIWAKKRSWDVRSQKTADFFLTMSKKG